MPPFTPLNSGFELFRIFGLIRAAIYLTTVGYGDIYPVSTVERIVTMISSIFGIAIVALPVALSKPDI